LRQNKKPKLRFKKGTSKRYSIDGNYKTELEPNEGISAQKVANRKMSNAPGSGGPAATNEAIVNKYRLFQAVLLG